MKTVGIIAEYNPFHNGHKYLIDKARNEGATHIVAVMSGNYVQRGECAIFDTATRVNACLDGGVDLVLQLPLPYAISGAQNFARGGIEILNAAKVVDNLYFGTENTTAEKLCELSEFLLSGLAEDEIKNQLKQGITYAKARENALQKLVPGLSEIVTTPNNILALEYVNALKKCQSEITPVAVNRMGAHHDSSETAGNIASASEIRKMLKAGENVENFVPNWENYKDKYYFDNGAFGKYETAVLSKMRSISREEIANSPDISEGIENRIFEAIATATTLEELYSGAKTKRYTHARIRRIVLNTFLGVTAEISSKSVPYIRVMGFNSKGAELIKKMQESATLPLITKASDLAKLGENAQEFFCLESRAADLYNLFKANPLPCGEEKKFVVISKNN